MKCEYWHATTFVRKNYFMILQYNHEMQLSRLSSYAMTTLCEEEVGQMGS